MATTGIDGQSDTKATSHPDEAPRNPRTSHAHGRDQRYPDFSEMTVSQYILTRLPTLIPPLDRVTNPIPPLRKLTGMQWLFFLVRVHPPWKTSSVS